MAELSEETIAASEELNELLAEDEQQDFDVYTATTEEMNARGLCGYRLAGSGRKCVRKIITWFGDTEDEGGTRVGGCGTHAKDIEAEIARQGSTLQRRQIEGYLEQEMTKAVNILRNAGIRANPTYRGRIEIENWQVMLAWLDDKGLDFNDSDWEKVVEERAAVEAAKICQNCLREHEHGENYYPECDKWTVHKFFTMKNNKDKCAICEGPLSTLIHDETMLGKG